MNTRASASPFRAVPVLIAFLLNIVLIVPPIAPSAQATHVAPSPKDGNPTCGEFGDYDHEFRINAPSNGTFTDPDSDFEVTLTFHNTSLGQTMDFSANLAVDAVFIKGGPNGNLYVYDPPGPPVTSDTGLHSQVNPSNGQYYGISHVSFCFDEPPRLPNLKIDKTPDGATVNAGDPISFSITVSNDATATGNATGVDIDDHLPTGFDWSENPDKTECSISTHLDHEDLHCEVGTLAPGASFTVTVSAPTDGSVCGNVLNTARATADGVSEITNDGSVTISCADIDVEKEPDFNQQDPGSEVTAGENATFTLRTSNTGPGEARGVKLTDTLPAVENGWTIFSSGWPAAPDPAACVITGAAPAAQTLSCGGLDGITLASGAFVDVTVTTTTDGIGEANDCGLLDNPAASVTTSNNGNDTDAGAINVLCAEIDVDKTPDDAEIVFGDVAAFEIITKNLGGGTATGVELDDDLPAVASGWEITASDWPAAGNPGACAITGDAGDTQHLHCGPVSLATLGELSVTVSATTTAEDCGPLNNPAADVKTTNDGTDTDPGSMTVLCPNPFVTKTAEVSPINAGEPATFDITVTGGGTGDSTNVELTDTVPTDHQWTVTGDISACDGFTIGDTELVLDGGEVLSCTYATIANGTSKALTITTTSTADDCAEAITNSVSITADDDVDTSSESNSDSASIDVDCPDLEIGKSVDESDLTVLAPDTVVYTILVTNSGDGDATDVLIKDELDLDAVVVGDVTYDIGLDGVDGTCSVTLLNEIGCTIGTLAAGESVEVVYTVSVTVDACPSLDNTASVGATNLTPTDETDNSDSVTLDVDCPDVSVLKEAELDEISSTESASYTITVSGGTIGTNADVTLADVLPAGFTWTVGGEDIGDCWVNADTGNPLEAGDTVAGGNTINCNFGSLDANETKTLTLTAQTAEDDCDIEISNTATVETDGDTDLEDNTWSASVMVECPELTALKTADDDLVSAGEEIGFTISISNADEEATGTAFDVTLDDLLPAGPGIDWEIAGDSLDGGACSIDGDAPDPETLECDFGDLELGDSVSVHVVSDTSLASCETYRNVATVDADNHAELLPEDSLTVECPELNVAKEARTGTIDAGEEAIFDIVVWNAGDGTAFDVTLTDDLPGDLDWSEDSDDCSIAGGVLTCDFGDLAGGSTKEDPGASVTLSAQTDRTDCGVLDNTAVADANPGEPVQSSDSITIRCPAIALEKENDTDGPVLPGTTVTYTLTLTVSDGPAQGVVVVDLLPIGIEDPTNISDDGEYDATEHAIVWELGDLANGSYELTYQAVVEADAEHGDELVNVAAATSPNSQCPDFETLGPECEDDSTVLVRVPTLVVDKVASAETIVIDGTTATPSSVTWTLSYTLSNGPVTDAVITDPVPTGVTFVSASDGGTYDDATRTITWNLGTLTTSGSVTFVTSVDVATISRTAPTVNVATIDSNETAPDSGQDSVNVEVEPPPLASTPTPRPSVPNTAAGIGLDGTPLTVPIELLAAFFLGSLGALALANVRAVARRRR